MYSLGKQSSICKRSACFVRLPFSPPRGVQGREGRRIAQDATAAMAMYKQQANRFLPQQLKPLQGSSSGFNASKLKERVMRDLVENHHYTYFNCFQCG